MLRNGMIFMYMYPVLREKEVLIRKLFSQKEEPQFQLQTHVYEWQRYQMERIKESSGYYYSIYKYFTPLPEVYIRPQIEKKVVESKNDQMDIYDLFSMMSP